MNAIQTFKESTELLHTADGLVTRFKDDTAFKGIVIGIAVSLPIWAAITLGGELVFGWF